MALFPENIIDKLEATRVVAGFTVDRAEHAVPVAQALLEGGINAIELTLRTAAALEGVRRVCAELPEMLTGVGTILTPEQAYQVQEAGAAFGVAPGMNPEVIRTCESVGLPFAPGIQTASELEQAISLGCLFVKLFPAEAAGGLPYLRAMSAPYRHLSIKFFPLGGISEANMSDYLAEDNVPVVGGSWIVKKDLVDREDWDAIALRARSVCEVLKV